MYLWFRFALTIVRALLGSKLSASGVSIVSMRVLPTDVDPSRMHNGRYPTIMDLGRIDLMIRQGYFFKVLRQYSPLVASQFIRYQKSLRTFQKYQLHSRFVYWDDKWAYLEHRFVVRGETYAVGYVKGLFRGPNGNLPIGEMFAMGHGAENSPARPPWVARFDDVFNEAGRTESAPV